MGRVNANVHMLASDGCVGGSTIAKKVNLEPIVVSVPFFTMMKTPVSGNCSSLLTSLTSYCIQVNKKGQECLFHFPVG